MRNAGTGIGQGSAIRDCERIRAHPWMANSARPQAGMLAEIGAASIDELFAQIPRASAEDAAQPARQLKSEVELKRHL